MPDVIAKGETLWFNAVLLLPSDLVLSRVTLSGIQGRG